MIFYILLSPLSIKKGLEYFEKRDILYSMRQKVVLFIVGAGAMLLLNACSLTTIAMRSTNPEFIGDQIPGILESNEKKLLKSPNDQALIFDTGSMYVMYANAFVQGPAEMLPSYEFDQREAAKIEAKAGYTRGVEILSSGLEQKYPGFTAAYQAGNEEAMAALMENVVKEDAPYLYWTAAGALSAYSLDPQDFDTMQKIGAIKVMVDTAYKLDPDFNKGAIDDFYVLFYGSLPEGLGGDKTKIAEHFALAVEKSSGLQLGPYISYVQTYALPAHDYDAYKENLEKALAIDINADKDSRLVNTINRRKAEYLLEKEEDYFIPDVDESAFEDEEPQYDESWFLEGEPDDF